MVRTIYQQPSPDEVHAQLQDRFPQVASLLDEAGPDILAFSSFPVPHWKKIWSNNPLERLNKEIRKEIDVAPMSWASSLTDQPCVAWLAPSSLNSTTNGPSAVDTSHPPFSPSMKLLQRPNPQKRLRLRQHQQDDALLHHLTGRDLLFYPEDSLCHCYCFLG